MSLLNPDVVMWSYWKLFEANEEQIWVRGLDTDTGGQLDGLIGGLSEEHLDKSEH